MKCKFCSSSFNKEVCSSFFQKCSHMLFKAMVASLLNEVCSQLFICGRIESCWIGRGEEEFAQ
jgi:hypothetical protein